LFGWIGIVFRPQVKPPDMFYAHRSVTLSRTGERGDYRVQAGSQEQKEGGDCHQAPLSSCQAAAEQPYPAVRPS